ncbi:MAG: mannose-1-phosphate guanylyltransferase [Legionellaceae bacterium]|nr:mannose-1-phosphate guanylyltransferase [Legionellaceae bacterium]
MRKAMILAAGYGKRMRELTQHVPKPLLPADNQLLIEHSLLRLAKAGFQEVVINISYLADQFERKLGDGSRYNVAIQYSREEKPLGWGGGIARALPLLGSEPFLAISGDLWTDYPFDQLRNMSLKALAHLVLVHESDFSPDYHLTQEGYITQTSPAHTYAGIGLFHPDLFRSLSLGEHGFAEIMNPVIKNHQVSGEIFDGSWFNVGTPECLTGLRQWLGSTSGNHEKS